MFVYLLTCSVNGKVYVGKTTTSLHIRWHNHVKHAIRGSNQLICRAIRKHGADNFIISVLAECSSKEELNRIEQEKIIEFDSRDPKKGYNVSKGGDGGRGHLPGKDHPMFGRKHSAETLAQMRLSHMGKHSTLSHKQNCQCGPCKARRGEMFGENNPRFGLKPVITDLMIETARKMGLSNKGRQHTPGQGRKQSIALRGIKRTPEQLQHYREAQHRRWHVSRGVSNPDCKFCWDAGLVT